MPEFVTHLVLADSHQRAQHIARTRCLLRWEYVNSSRQMLGLRRVVLHIQRGYVETPKMTHVTLELPGRSIAWGTETDFPILRTVQIMLASGSIQEVRPDA